jgi:hypothetical protein
LAYLKAYRSLWFHPSTDYMGYLYPFAVFSRSHTFNISFAPAFETGVMRNSRPVKRMADL